MYDGRWVLELWGNHFVMCMVAVHLKQHKIVLKVDYNCVWGGRKKAEGGGRAEAGCGVGG